MNPALITAIAAVVVAGIGFVVPYLTRRDAQRTRAAEARMEAGKVELDQRRVDGEQFDRLQEASDRMINRLEKTVAEQAELIAALRRDLDVERANRARETRALRRQLGAMRTLLEQNGITPPAVDEEG